MNTKYKNLLFDADQTLIDFEKDMPLAFQYMYEQSGLQNKSHTAQRFCAFITTATKVGGGVLSKSSAPKQSCTATVSSISLKSRGSHRSASIFCKTCMSPA